MWEPAAIAATPGARASLLENVSCEAPPKQILARNSEVRALARGCRVYVPFLRGADFSETIAACRILVQQGFCAVPHVPARQIGSVAQVADWLAELRTIGCTDLFLVAGDTSRAGRYADTLELLDSGLMIDHGFRRIGVAGYPESHPHADAATLADALRTKRDYALSTGTSMWVVTQFVFRAEIFLQWLERHREAIEPMPVLFGCPGPSSLSTLLKYARQCGVASSLSILGKKPSLVSLATDWHPGAMLETICLYAEASPLTPLQGCHLFPFGGLKQSAEWLERFREADQGIRTI